MSRKDNETLAIVAGSRTPFRRAGSDLSGAAAADLATHVFRELLDTTGIDENIVSEVILGCAGPDASEANVARVAALRAGLPQSTPAITIMRNCASGMESLFAAQTRLRAGEGDVFLVGGAESMSNYPLMYGRRGAEWFARLAKSKTPLQKLATIASFRPSLLKPRIAIMEGLTDSTTGLMMGHTAENIARKFGITREEQDEFARDSHQKAAEANEGGRFECEIAPMTTAPKFNTLLASDNGIREGQNMAALSKLRPVFDKKEGDVTVGNSCQVTDGACAMLVMSLARAKSLGLKPLALVRSQARAGLDPAYMGLGPVHATPLALESAGLAFSDIDLMEINEAFAAQVLGCLRAFESDSYCRDAVGLPGAIGSVNPGIVNVNGGAIALGHPIAATGARITFTLAEELQQSGKQFGLATLCIGGGQGQAIILEAA